MKTKHKITMGFTAEIVFFVLTGIYFANGQWGYAIVAVIFATIFGGAVGKLIEKDAIEKYKKEIRKWK